jgi:hypothetical protein
MTAHAIVIVFEGEGADALADQAARKIDRLFKGRLMITIAPVDVEKMKEALG